MPGRHVFLHAAPDDAGESGGDVFGQAHGLADVAHRTAAAIGDDGCGNAGAVAPVTRINVLDHFLAPFMLEIDIDVGRFLAFLGNEALEKKIDRGRVDIGDAEAITDGGIGGRAANSAVCYCLGITNVDPSTIDLLFERFVSEERKEPPDIDVDFEHEQREEVIKYIYSRYGRDRAGLAATVIT